MSEHSFAVFPFLKTTGPIALGGIRFRSTDDVSDLDPVDAEHVRTIAQMLFLQDDLRVRSASYAVVSFVDMDYPQQDPHLEQLRRIQAVVAYCYSQPMSIHGDVFLSAEHAALAVFSPTQVFSHLVQPEHHTELVGKHDLPEADQFGRMNGYAGYYDFKHPFWVVKGSRLYPPMPHIGLNISQNLAADLDLYLSRWPHFNTILWPAGAKPSELSLRILTAIEWFNRSASDSASEEVAIVSLAIAFESLLAGPEFEKRDRVTERLVDSISLLLGRVSRLDSWAQQFYKARSEIVHHGRAQALRFMIPGSHKKTAGPSYRPLLTYGRFVFRACAATLLVGAELAREADMEEMLVTNQERYEQICQILYNDSLSARDRFSRSADIVFRLERFSFVPEAGLDLATMTGAVRAAAKALLASGEELDTALKQCAESIQSALRSSDHYEELDALARLPDKLAATGVDPVSPTGVFLRLAHVTWMYTFGVYYSLRKKKEKDADSATVTAG